jgi:serine/threonine protein kinase
MMPPPMEAAQSELRAGDRLDRYELLCPIASGGMATVWLARLRGKRGFEKLFAIKTIRTELVDDPRFQEMLLDEARIASSIQHPNVAQILDLGEERNVLFIVMERVDGDSVAKIRKLLARLGAAVPVGIALRILADACAGLHAAHELRDEQGQPLGIVHRDVSPQNILVSVSGAVKVIDFGIAKAQNRQQGETRTGVVKGKVQYMAPEQVKKGHAVDRRADIWALGVCLHELVTGKVPNDGDDHVEVIRKVLSDEPPQLAEGLPDPIGRILDKSLTLDPKDRFPTAAAMQHALEDAMDELDAATTSSDVATFLRTELPELEEKRRALVTQSVDEARGRELTPVPSAEDDAYAPTVMRERMASTKPSRMAENDDDEPIKIPKQSRAWLWALLLVIVAGVGLRVTHPPAVSRVLSQLGLGSSLQWLVPQEGSPRPSPAPATDLARSSSPTSATSAAPSGQSAAVSAASAHNLAPPRPSGTHAALHDASSPTTGLSATTDASPAALASSRANGAWQTTPSATATASTPPPTTATPQVSSEPLPETHPAYEAGANDPYGN